MQLLLQWWVGTGLQGKGWDGEGVPAEGQQQQEGEKLFMLTVSSGGGAVPLQWQGGPPAWLSTGDSDSSAESAGGSGSWEVYYTFLLSQPTGRQLVRPCGSAVLMIQNACCLAVWSWLCTVRPLGGIVVGGHGWVGVWSTAGCVAQQVFEFV